MPTAQRPGIALAVAAALALAAAGCSSRAAPPPPADAEGVLAAAAGHLDAATTFRLTLDTTVPAAPPAAAGPVVGPAAGAASRPAPPTPTAPATPTPRPTPYRIDLTGTWDTARRSGTMRGTLNGVASTVLTADGVEYISLAPGTGVPTGKSWLKVDGGDGTFGAFSDPHLVAQLLRAHHGVALAGKGHVTGTILTAEADQHIADPNLIASLSGYPASLAFDLTADGTGAPTRISFRLAGDPATTSGDVQLGDFGVAAPEVEIPTADQLVEAPAHG